MPEGLGSSQTHRTMFKSREFAIAGSAGIAAGVAVVIFGLSFSVAVLAAYLAATMTLIALIDLRSFTIPDIASLPAIPLGLVAAALAQGADSISVPIENWIGATAGPAFLYVVNLSYRKIRGHNGLGMGDVKLIAASGAWVGIGLLPYVLLLACVGALLAIALLYSSKRGAEAINLTTPLPFGAFLAPATFLIWMLALWEAPVGWSVLF